MSRGLGDVYKRQILASVPEWSQLQEEITLNNSNRPLFSYFKIPQANAIDINSPLGVSCYAKASDLIKEADNNILVYYGNMKQQK